MLIERRTVWTLLAWLALLAWAGCGGSANRPQETEPFEPERENPIELESDQIERLDQLEIALARPEPDCSTACDLSDAICGLSSRICGIAARHGGDDELQGQCRNATERCDRGRERVGGVCTCAAP